MNSPYGKEASMLCKWHFIIDIFLTHFTHMRNMRNERHTNITKTRLFKYILKISPPKTESFQTKFLIFFHISAQNIDCWFSLEPPRRGGSNEYPQSMFLSRSNKTIVYHCKPQFYYIKVGFMGVKIIWVCFRDVYTITINSFITFSVVIYWNFSVDYNRYNSLSELFHFEVLTS